MITGWTPTITETALDVAAGDTASFAAYRSLVKQPVDRELLRRVASWVAARGRASDGGAAGA